MLNIKREFNLISAKVGYIL